MADALDTGVVKPVNGILYATPSSSRTKILIASLYGGANIKVENPSNGLDASKFPFKKEFLAFESVDGIYIHETRAIAALVGGKCLSGSNLQESSEIVYCLDLEEEFLPKILACVLPSLSVVQKFNKTNVDEGIKELLRLLDVVNNFLSTRTFLVGERLTLVDIFLSCDLLLAYKHVLEPQVRAPYVNVNHWFLKCVSEPNFVAVLGEVKLCEKAEHFDERKFEEIPESSCASSHHHSDKKEEKGDKKDTKEKGGANGEERKEEGEEEKKEEEADAADEALALEPKQNDPFAAMPKSTFNIGIFKRVFFLSNENRHAKALFYFWTNLDKENYSIWYCEYKSPQDLTSVFKSRSLIVEMYKRLNELRENAFGSMCMFGSDNNSTISGVWIWRGQDLVFTFSEAWQIDFESYNWEKLDSNSDETKKIVQEYLTWDGEFGGKKFSHGEIF